MKTGITKIATLLGFSCLLAACNSLQVTAWTNPDFEGRPIGKTMVLGVAESVELSKQYEGLFTDRLNELDIDSDSLHLHISREEIVTEEEIIQLLKEHDFDSIIVTRLLSEQERLTISHTYPDYYGDYYGYYSHAFNTGYIETFTEYELETNLYDVEANALVWSGRSFIYDDRSDMANMKDIIKVVIKNLRKQSMVD